MVFVDASQVVFTTVMRTHVSKLSTHVTMVFTLPDAGLDA
jgi:hypothetical protein